MPTDSTEPYIPSTSIRSPTSKGLSIASINEFTIFPSVCCTAKPIIIENTAKDANKPNISIFNSANAKYIAPNQIIPLKKNVISLPLLFDCKNIQA